MFLSEWSEFPSVPCLAEGGLDDSLHLDVVEISHVPDMLPSLFPSWSGQGLINTFVYEISQVTITIPLLIVYFTLPRKVINLKMANN